MRCIGNIQVREVIPVDGLCMHRVDLDDAGTRCTGSAAYTVEADGAVIDVCLEHVAELRTDLGNELEKISTYRGPKPT